MSKLQAVLDRLTEAERAVVVTMLDDIEGVSMFLGVPPQLATDALTTIGQEALNGVKTKHQLATLLGNHLVATGAIEAADMEINEKSMTRVDSYMPEEIKKADFRFYTLIAETFQADEASPEAA